MAKVPRTKWYGETVKALQINGKSRRTQECYARAVRMLIEYSGKEPDRITGEELRDYFLYRKNECQWAPNTMKICYCGIRFFYGHVIRRDRHIFNILKSKKERRLPCVLSREEVYSILRCSVLPHEMRPFRDTGWDGPFFKESVFLNSAVFSMSPERTGHPRPVCGKNDKCLTAASVF